MLQDILTFTAFLQEFRKIERIVLYPESEKKENDTEHSFQLALTARYIIEKKKLSLDINKVLKYALVHDLVETYAGDTLPFDEQSEEVLSKHKREGEALQCIKNKFTDTPAIWQWIDEYEEKANKEAIFVYALDKLMPEFNIILDKGRSWSTFDVGRTELKQHMQKSEIDTDVYVLCEEIFEQLDIHNEWFPRE